MKLPAYPRYKPSGVEWLGDVPEHWDVKRLSCLATLKSGENITSEMIAEGGDYPVYGGNGLRGSYHKFTHRGHYALIGRQGALCGNINYACGEFWASEHALVVSPLKEFAIVWMGELLRAMNLGQYSVTAAQPGIAAEMIRGLRIPVPTLAEQRAIAAFLDRETGRIDRLMAKKREFIERLKEKRAELINAAMSGDLRDECGRDFCRPWKFSSHPGWQRKRLKHLATMKGRLGWQGLRSDEYTDDGPYLVSSEHFVDDRIDWDQCNHVSEERFRIAPEIIIRIDDVLFMKDGAAMGKLAYVDRLSAPACLNSHLLVIRPDHEHCLPRFVYYALKSRVFEGYMVQERTGTTFYGLSQESMGNFELSYPSIAEQLRIVSYLDRETAKLDALVAKVEAAVERLQEYRNALITAAVTGKVDVSRLSKQIESQLWIHSQQQERSPQSSD